MLKTRARPHLLKVSARALAILVFLYFLNAFIQTGYDTVLQVISELIVGILWLLICFTLSQRVSIVTILALSFGISILWGIFTEGVPVDEFRNYYIQAASPKLKWFLRAVQRAVQGEVATYHSLLRNLSLAAGTELCNKLRSVGHGMGRRCRAYLLVCSAPRCR